MSGLNGFRLLDAPQFSIPLTGGYYGAWRHYVRGREVWTDGRQGSGSERGLALR